MNNCGNPSTGITSNNAALGGITFNILPCSSKIFSYSFPTLSVILSFEV